MRRDLFRDQVFLVRLARLHNDGNRKPVERSGFVAFVILRLTENRQRGRRVLRRRPAMEGGVTRRLWSFEDMVGVVDEWVATQKGKSDGE
jgi:hypothetical protein